MFPLGSRLPPSRILRFEQAQRALQRLGLKRHPRDITPSLSEIINEHEVGT
jgi:hypothetical protein